MAIKSRTRTPAIPKTIPIPQSKTMAASQITELGNAKREFERIKTQLDDDIAKLTEAAQPQLHALQTTIDHLEEGLKIWCEANRVAICMPGTKTAKFVTGEISWHNRPPSVQVRGAEDVLMQLRENQLYRFIREKFEVNKEAVLNDPEAIKDIKGLTVVSGLEDFIVVPFEVQVQTP